MEKHSQEAVARRAALSTTCAQQMFFAAADIAVIQFFMLSSVTISQVYLKNTTS